MERSEQFMDQEYEYKGLWDVPSKCGLKIITKSEVTIAIATELYDDNPGTSVANWSHQLATEICLKNSADPQSFIFIEHTPDMKSRLSFYEETFFKVNYEWDGEKFVNPQWETLARKQVEEMIA